MAGIEDTTGVKFPSWEAELAREALMERKELRERMCACHPNIKFLFKVLMRE